MDYALPIGFAVFAWWLSTVVLIYRAGMPRATFTTTMTMSTVVMLLGAWALIATRNDTSTTGAYLAFVGALSVWGWHEVSYLFGFVAGPRPKPCPPGTSGWARFALGVKTCAYHEALVIATAGVLAAVFWTSPNRVGLWTFVILWLMRWSAKLNIFLGVRNLHAEYWPEHLRYLESFVRRRNMNELFPASIIIATIGLAVLGGVAISSAEDPARRAGALLLATLLFLAILEHGFLILRIRDDALWAPGMRSRRNGPAAPG
jgi:putative photosynthetic complex assembly protein 2